MATAAQRSIRKVFHSAHHGSSFSLAGPDRASVEAANATADDRVLAILVRHYENGGTLNWSAGDRATIQAYGGGSTVDQRMLKALVLKAEGNPAGLNALGPSDFTTTDGWV